MNSEEIKDICMSYFRSTLLSIKAEIYNKQEEKSKLEDEIKKLEKERDECYAKKIFLETMNIITEKEKTDCNCCQNYICYECSKKKDVETKITFDIDTNSETESESESETESDTETDTETNTETDYDTESESTKKPEDLSESDYQDYECICNIHSGVRNTTCMHCIKKYNDFYDYRNNEWNFPKCCHCGKGKKNDCNIIRHATKSCHFCIDKSPNGLGYMCHWCEYSQECGLYSHCPWSGVK